MIELIVFDMAGTTVYDGDAVNESFRAALAAFGIGADPAFVNTVMGLHKPEAIRILLDRGGQHRRGRGRGNPRRLREADARTCDRPRGPRDPGCGRRGSPPLRRAGVKVALTSTGRSLGCCSTACGFALAAIDADVASDEVPHGRPEPDMIRPDAAARSR